MNTKNLIKKMHQSRCFELKDVEFMWIDHEKVWIVNHKDKHVYAYMDTPYTLKLFKLAYYDGNIEEITNQIPLNKVNRESIVKTISEINNKIAIISY